MQERALTIGVGLRLPGMGCVLACDSRITTDDGTIVSDYDEKWAECGSIVALCAGSLGALWDDLRETPTKNWREFRAKVTNLQATQQDLEYEILLYDRRKDRLLLSSHHGDGVVVRNFGGIGAGAAYALGYLDGAPAPTSLTAATKLVENAVRVACKRNSSCGGRIRVLTIPNKPRSAVVVR